MPQIPTTRRPRLPKAARGTTGRAGATEAPGRDTVTALTANPTGAVVECPRCGDRHHYAPLALQPLPIRAGDKRVVLCTMGVERPNRKGHILRRIPTESTEPFYITFTRQDTK